MSAEAKPEHRHKGQGIQTSWYSPEAVCAALRNMPPSPTSKTHESRGESLMRLIRQNSWALIPMSVWHWISLMRVLFIVLNLVNLREGCCLYSRFHTWGDCTVKTIRDWRILSGFLLPEQTAALLTEFGRIGIHCDVVWFACYRDEIRQCLLRFEARE